jgi:hypothetical protein
MFGSVAPSTAGGDQEGSVFSEQKRAAPAAAPAVSDPAATARAAAICSGSLKASSAPAPSHGDLELLAFDDGDRGFDSGAGAAFGARFGGASATCSADDEFDRGDRSRDYPFFR